LRASRRMAAKRLPTHVIVPAVRFARVMHRRCPPGISRAQGRPGAGRTRGLVCSEKSTRVRNRRFDRCDPAFPARWCYGVYALSPVCRLGSHRRRRTLGVSGRSGPTSPIRQLDPSVGGPGPHDFAVRPAVARLATQGVHRIPHPTSVTIAKRPSCERGTARTMSLIWPSDKAKSFSKEGLTGFRKISPSGKSVQQKRRRYSLNSPSRSRRSRH
jgi:hypothetical protein